MQGEPSCVSFGKAIRDVPNDAIKRIRNYFIRSEGLEYIVSVKMINMAKHAIALSMSVFLFLAGACDHSKSIAERPGWWEGGPGAPGLKPGHNFYLTDIGKYPEVAILYHTIDAATYSSDVEKRACLAGMSSCRKTFGDGFRQGNLEAFDSTNSQKEKWKDGVPIVPFKPKWIVIIVRNERDFVNGDPMLTAKRIYKVGIVIAAQDLFNEKVSDQKLVENAFRDEHPIGYDSSADTSDRTKFLIVDRFLEKINENDVKERVQK